MYFAPTRSAPLQQNQDINNRNMYPDENHEPYLEILEHPKARGFRFRYSCEGPSHGGIPGASSDKNKKTYPSVQIRNYTGYARIVVQLVTNEENPRLHPHSLVGKQCQNGICTVQCGPKDMTATFPNLGIQHVTKKNVAKILEERYMAAEMQLSSMNDGLSIDVQNAIKDEDRSRIKAKAIAEAKSIDLSVVRLMFIAYLPDSNGAFVIMLKPVISDAIFDSKSPNAATLKICRMDKSFGAATGMDEVYLLCDKVQKDDIQVRFYEEDHNGEELWDGYGDFSPTDVHRQFAIVFRTPRYKNVAIENPVQVLVQLRRKSDGEVSESRPFTYMPVQDDPEQIHSKRRKVAAHFQDHISGQRASGGGNQGNMMTSHGSNYSFQANGNSSGMKQSRYGPPPKAKNPQAGPLDPSMLVQINLVKKEPRSPQMNGMPGSNPSSPYSNSGSPASNQSYGANSPMSVSSQQFSDNGDLQNTFASQETQYFPGTRIPMPRPLAPVVSQPIQQQMQFVPISLAQQPATTFMGQVDTTQFATTSTSNALYYDPNDVTGNFMISNVVDYQAEEVVDDSVLEQLMTIVSQANTFPPMTSVANTGNEQLFDANTVMEIISSSDILEVETDSVAEDQEPTGAGAISAEDFGRGMNDTTKPSKVEIQVTDSRVPVESDSCSIAPREVEISTGPPLKQVELSAAKEQVPVSGMAPVEEKTKTEVKSTNVEKNSSMKNETDDMKLSGEPELITRLDGDSLRTLLSNITVRTARALQDFAATGDIRILLATQRQLTDVQDSDGDTSLHLAVINGQDEVLLALVHLIQTIPDSHSIVNRKNDLLLTPLHIAIHIENINAVKWLMSAGADVLTGDSKGNSALHLACSTGQSDILEHLLKAKSAAEETHNYDGHTPLHLLARKVSESSRQCIDLLLSRGHNVDAGDMKSGRSALHMAVQDNNLIVAGYLLAECNADIECRTYEGYTPLHIAVACDCQEVATLLLACGADPNAEYSEDFPSAPLTLCVSQKMRDILTGENAFDNLYDRSESIQSYIEDDDIDCMDPVARIKLCRVLNRVLVGNDWYALAKHLGLGTRTGFAEALVGSTAEALLDNYSCIRGTVTGLKAALARAGRMDALEVLDKNEAERFMRDTLPKHDQDVDRIDSAIGSMSLTEQISIPEC